MTELVNAEPDKPHLVRVEVDEKVGHNSQGFLPVFAPHFGGIWQDIKLMIVPETWINDLATLSIGDPQTGRVRLVLPLSGTVGQKSRVVVRSWRVGENKWTNERSFNASLSDGQLTLEVPIDNWQVWSPATPNLYELEIRLADQWQISPANENWKRTRVTTRAAFRTMKVNGDQLLLNDQPVSIRGLLNWGYAPPRVAPHIDEQQFRRELEFARSYGFNLMKFCLWVPPKRYLEIADEMGMLTWVEYPTWHSKWTPDQLPKLRREFTEFFHYDRNHPSVVLRSLTCETGPSADLGVIQSLYDLCHQEIPGSIVEDDSSWISWNRVHDFYDDHPYGNNHTWVATLSGLKEHIKNHGAKPLVLGEAIAADTWTAGQPLLDDVGTERPFWLPNYFEGNRQWLELIRKVDGKVDVERLEAESKRYALLMRKFQIETYRREVPSGGYVVSVIRDFPFASMGLIDFRGEPKWSADKWDWHGDSLLILKTENDRRSFSAGEQLSADLMLSHFGGTDIRSEDLEISAFHESTGHDFLRQKVQIDQANGTLANVQRIEFSLPDVDQPTRVLIRTQLTTSNHTLTNEWPIWVVPSTNSTDATKILIHKSATDEATRHLFPHGQLFEKASADQLRDAIIVASQFDASLLDFLLSGGKVLLLPNGEKSSLPLSDEWFLRGGPYLPDHPLLSVIPRQMLVELQHFDLAGSVIPDIMYLEQIDPILMLWNNHDIDRVKTQGLVFQTRVGKGRLLVSALNHGTSTNSAGRWILDSLVRHLANPHQPTHEFSAATIQQLREKIVARKIELAKIPWEFKPDTDNVGLQEAWHQPDLEIDDSWKSIKIGQSWEGQGFANLDGWAWYRLQIDVPQDWQGQKIYISTEGVDDHYELYVNGHRVGSGGNIDTKATAFEERTSHDVTNVVVPGMPCSIAVRVYDWYGAGGIHRPITIGTARLSSGVQILK